MVLIIINQKISIFFCFFTYSLIYSECLLNIFRTVWYFIPIMLDNIQSKGCKLFINFEVTNFFTSPLALLFKNICHLIIGKGATIILLNNKNLE